MEKCQDNQLSEWRGDFGDAYVGRNMALDHAQGETVFSRMLAKVKTEIRSALEVGCNVGNNLAYLNHIFPDSVELLGVEPNEKAFSIFQQRCPFVKTSWNCSGYSLPLEDNSVDLVFTSGVLIHIHPDRLRQITSEIVRVSKKYVLCLEYFSHTPVAIPYQNKSNLLFKMDFGAYYLQNYPELQTVDYGFIWMQEFPLFDNLNWWLFQKPEAPAGCAPAASGHPLGA